MVSLASHVGGACSPFVVQMTRVNAILPFASMGGLSFMAALFCWFLPETLGKRTPEVMEDTEVKQGIHIDHFHKWRPIKDSFDNIKISLTNLILKSVRPCLQGERVPLASGLP